MSDDCELLFFDTFSHDSCEELNLDLVQFPRTVYIYEIRVIPLGARVLADFPGGFRLGATNPSSFKLEFFVNDLSKRSACTFERLGSLEYKQNVDIQFAVSNKIPTDGLVLRGWYSAVTLAVYGVLTKAIKERTSPPPPPPPQPTVRPQSTTGKEFECPVVDPAVGVEWDHQQRVIEPAPEPPLPPIRCHAPPPPPPPPVVETPRFAEVPPMVLPPAEPLPPYTTDMPQQVFSEAVTMSYPEHMPPPVSAVPVPYTQYEVPHYTKPWSGPEDQFQTEADGYDRSVYNRPQNITVPHASWDNKESCVPPEMGGIGQEHNPYNPQAIHDLKPHPRDKDVLQKDRDRDRERGRDRPWERESHSSEYKDDDSLRRDSKRKDRDHRSRETSWERGTVEPERYRDRERDRDKDRDRSKDSVNMRDRDREREKERSRERSREKVRGHEMFGDRGPRMSPRELPPKEIRETLLGKRPITPPSPQKTAGPRTPQTPPDVERPITGPRTPKEDEPGEVFEERIEDPAQVEEFFSSPDHMSGEQLYNLSEGEIQDGENTEEDDGYEEIVSEEEDMSDGESRVIDMAEIDYDLGDETWNYMSSFNPYQCDLTALQYFDDPTLTPLEIAEKKHSKGVKEKPKEDIVEETNKLSNIINQFSDKEHNEKWVEALESISMTTVTEELTSLSSEPVFEATVNTLINWVVEGLDFEAALKQPQTAYKVRHLKAGIRFATFLFKTNFSIAKKLLDVHTPKRLIELYEQPYMALPVKLLILRALDAATFMKAGLDYILYKNVEFQSPKNFNSSDNSEIDRSDKMKCTSGYQKLLDILISKQLTRTVVSVTALLNKIHLYEVLLQLRNSVEKMVLSTQTSEPKVVNEESVDQATTAHELDGEPTESPHSSSEETLTQIIIGCLREITSVYGNAEKTVTQPLRHVPARIQYETPRSPFDPYPGLLRMFKENQLLESIFVVLSSPALAGHIGVLSAIKDLFLEFLRSQKGMVFLLTSSDSINGIHRALLQTLDEAREENSDENIAQNLAMQIAYHLQALLYVDCLFSYQSRGGPKQELDDPEVVSALHHMYTMIFSPIGRQAVFSILAMEQNLNSIVPFVIMPGDEEFDTKLAKSVCTGYVTELIMLTIHYSESITLLENFSETLFNLSQQDPTPKLHDLSLWMAPTRKITNYTHEAVITLVSILKDQAEDAASLPPELITTVRILQHITLSAGQSEDLKYMYAIVQLVTSDGLPCFLTILQRIAETFLKPSHQSAALVGLQGVLVVALVKPVICMMKSILGYLISCRGTEFKDLTSVPVLLQVFSVMSLVPSSSFAYSLAQMVQAEVIETLLTYTQPCLGSSESEEALSKSLWTEMIQEVLKYIMQSPSTFMVGLTVLSELLPLPLPLQTREPLSPDEVSKVVNNRKLWSAHLHSLSSAIQEVIINLAASSCHPLQQLLRRLCIQLADLAAPTALVVVRSVLDALLDSLASICPPEQKEDAPPALLPTPVLPCSSWSARLLNLVAYLVSHAAFKIPLMHILRGSVKADEKYIDLLHLLLKQLNVVSDKPAHIQSQECIVSILQSLCDPDIGFITFESGSSVQEVLSSCLPAKEHMSQICGALIQHIGNHLHNYASILPSLRSLVMLTEHDYGFYHVKQGLEQHPRALFSLFSRLSSSFSKDSSDCLSTLSTTLEFLRLLVNGYEDGAQTGRSLLLTPAELSSLLSGRSDFGKEKADKAEEPITFLPLLELENFLTECANDEEAVESLLESVSGLIQLLNEVVGKEDKTDKEALEPILPAPESQSVQFASRPVFIVGEVEEGRLSPAYWLSIPGADDADQEQEQVSTNLVDLAENYTSGEYDLKSDLERLCSLADADSDMKSKKSGLTIGKRKYQPLVNPAAAEVTSKKPFIAPMRGRGFNRANAHSSRANDPFRSRPPNTSRPPSMHVDDFVALESHQPSNSAQAPVKRPPKESTRGRGRGFERGQAFTSTRGGGVGSGGGGGGGGGGGAGNCGGGGGNRFFSPPGPYSRRDTVRGGNRGASRISNNAWGNRVNSNSVQKPPTSTGNRTNFGGRGRCNYSFAFNQNEARPVGQRNRDPYAAEGGPPPGAMPIGGRFIRGVRTGGPNQQSMQGQWQDNRNKPQGGRFSTAWNRPWEFTGQTSRITNRFMPANPQGRGGGGRRDLNIRHARAFTR